MKARFTYAHLETLNTALLSLSIIYILNVCVIFLERWITKYAHTLTVYLFFLPLLSASDDSWAYWPISVSLESVIEVSRQWVSAGFLKPSIRWRRGGKAIQLIGSAAAVWLISMCVYRPANQLVCGSKPTSVFEVSLLIRAMWKEKNWVIMWPDSVKCRNLLYTLLEDRFFFENEPAKCFGWVFLLLLFRLGPMV